MSFPISERLHKHIGGGKIRIQICLAMCTAYSRLGGGDTPGHQHHGAVLQGERTMCTIPTPVPAPNGSTGRRSSYRVAVTGIVSLSSALKPYSFNRDGGLGGRLSCSCWKRAPAAATAKESSRDPECVPSASIVISCWRRVLPPKAFWFKWKVDS